MATKLPKLTPTEIKEWVRQIEKYHPVGHLAVLPFDASLPEIKEAYESDRDTLIGIGEALMEAARWSAWPDKN
jgi:hypothetical protein